MSRCHWHTSLAFLFGLQAAGSQGTAPIVQCLEHQKMHSFNVEKAPLTLKAPSSIWPQRDVAQPSTSGCRNTGCSKSNIYSRILI